MPYLRKLLPGFFFISILRVRIPLVMHIAFYNATVRVASYVLSINLAHPYSHSNAMGKPKYKVMVFVSVG